MTTYTLEQLRHELSEDTIRDPFGLLRAISVLAAADWTATVAQDLILRALERRDSFGESRPVLDALVRQVGLFPYLESDSLSVADQLAYELHRPENMGDDVVFHRPQAEVYQTLLRGQNVILSAPTSFGKSLIIDAVIATGRFKNILIVVPTLALIDETRRRLQRRFGDSFNVITRPSQKRGVRNILVFTQERVLECESLEGIDFFAIDEFYKLSPHRDSDDRCARLNHAFYRLAKTGAQFYLLGPNVEGIAPDLKERLSYQFIPADYHTVASELHDLSRRARGDPFAQLLSLCETLSDPTIIFCSSPQRVAAVAERLAEAGLSTEASSTDEAVQWLGKHYHADWHFAKALRSGIGVHHGRIPRSLAQFVVRAFNDGRLRFLVCTSTLIEGVNTKAKNVVVFDNKIRQEKIDYFTFNNIKGRSGRMFQHFIGHVYLFHEPPTQTLPFVDVPIFTQPNDTDEGLLLQLDDDELSDGSRQRLRQYQEQGTLSVETLRRNAGVDPRAQLAFAEALTTNAREWSTSLAWNRFPTAAQVQFVAKIIWDYFGGKDLARNSVVSHKQLAFLINALRLQPSTRMLIEKQFKYHKDWDKAVQVTLDFMRLWATFHFPRLLRAIGAIQREVLGRLGYLPGDYDAFASQVESLFLDAGVVALDEYGIPLETARTLAPLVSADGDLDETLRRLKRLSLADVAALSPFEQQLVLDAQENI